MNGRITLLLAALMLAALTVAPAGAQESLNGNWKISEGRYGKSNYEGDVEIKSSVGLYKFYWNTAGAEYWGFGTEVNGYVYVAWSHAPNFGYVLYNIYSDSSIAGMWSLSSEPEQNGQESARGGSLDAKNSTWRVLGNNPSGNAPYHGTLEMTREGDLYHLVWHVNEDTYYGAGLRSGDKLVVGWGAASDNFGAAAYYIQNNGLKGRWVTHSGNEIGIENLKRVRE